MSHLRLIILGFLLLLVGAVLPFVMVIRLVESTFLLNFVAATSSIGGLTVGLIGIVQYNRSRRQGMD
ncbi:hypothetical protein M1O14_00080 [Dehalococcoidia bacterium]|nr:hypothetical protein [Dehalococcoidia bacterium]MCL0070377.1 hypothetical protein [Dehalococcoidia bacterium]MCL0082125.1 hypothetical protein [Dehalococcoidia bacterium]